jgi:hypothetical protein
VASPPALCTYVVDELDWFLPSEQFGLMCASPCGDVDVASVRIHHMAAYFCLAGAERSIPKARQGRASWREGLTAKAHAKQQSV